MISIHYTAESLGALSERELDALAHEAVFGQRVSWIALDDERRPIIEGVGTLPNYSTNRDDAALLEHELFQRGLDFRYKTVLCEVVDPINRHCYDAITADAHSRTIAAILTAQDME